MKTLYKHNFAPRLIKERKEMKLSQRELATKLGISKSTIASYEIERTEPDLETLGKIATFFCHTVDYFLGLSDE